MMFVNMCEYISENFRVIYSVVVSYLIFTGLFEHSHEISSSYQPTRPSEDFHSPGVPSRTPRFITDNRGGEWTGFFPFFHHGNWKGIKLEVGGEKKHVTPIPPMGLVYSPIREWLIFMVCKCREIYRTGMVWDYNHKSWSFGTFSS